MRAVDYQILSSDSREELVAAIIKWIDKGWQPLGGVSVGRSERYVAPGVTTPTIVYAQALVKYEGDEP